MNALLRQTLTKMGLSPEETESVPITLGQSGSQIYRLTMDKGNNVILKITEPTKMPEYLTLGYPNIAVSEYKFYTELAPTLAIGVPHVIKHGLLPDNSSFLLLEDLAPSYFIPPEIHVWSTGELESILSAYAVMHGKAQTLFANSGIPKWLQDDPRSTYSAAETLACLQELRRNDWTEAQVRPIVSSSKLEVLLQKLGQALTHVPVTLLFNDFYPPNVAIPRVKGSALLLDWQLAGSGPLHLDLVNIGFLRQGVAFEQVDRTAMVDFYLDKLAEGIGWSQTREAFLQDYRWANLLACTDFLPRFVFAMHKSNTSRVALGKWMNDTFAVCIDELRNVLE
ncbi:MAG TPA: phosphotransferase [Bacteroidales bacterium]|nr:phosphotransferase [Bacteroidales bacterium]